MIKNIRHGKSNRFAELAKLGELLFHTDDLANLWRINNKNTLHTTIKRYTAQGLLIRIHKGFYALKPPNKIDPCLLGTKALHGYTYVSTETILKEEGIAQQSLPYITLVSGKTLRFTCANNTYYSRKLPDKFLYQPNGIIIGQDGAPKAGISRAVADLLYFNPHVYLDAPGRINWNEVRALQETLGYPLTLNRYDA